MLISVDALGVCMLVHVLGTEKLRVLHFTDIAGISLEEC